MIFFALSLRKCSTIFCSHHLQQHHYRFFDSISCLLQLQFFLFACLQLLTLSAPCLWGSKSQQISDLLPWVRAQICGELFPELLHQLLIVFLILLDPYHQPDYLVRQQLCLTIPFRQEHPQSSWFSLQDHPLLCLYQIQR